MDFSMYVAKTKVLISCAVTLQLICTFVFEFAKFRFSHDAAHMTVYGMLYCRRPVGLTPGKPT